jgi:hypothetical protein
MTGNKLLMAQATYDYKMAMKRKGINTLIPMLNLLQIPILFTWFFSLRYATPHADISATCPKSTRRSSPRDTSGSLTSPPTIPTSSFPCWQQWEPRFP